MFLWNMKKGIDNARLFLEILGIQNLHDFNEQSQLKHSIHARLWCFLFTCGSILGFFQGSDKYLVLAQFQFQAGNFILL